MNKSQFIEELRNRLARRKIKNFNPEDTKDIVNIFVKYIIDALREGNRVEFRGFGVFELRPYKGYKGLNPRTKKPIRVGKKFIPFFKCGKGLVELLNKHIGLPKQTAQEK
jgi:integration host factor subunit beta